jgi:myo-inositol-1-phosphate synthase
MTSAAKRAVRVAIVGVGNCASALVQGVHKYRDASADEFVPGLMHVDLGGYHVRDIQFVAAFDVDARKVGHDLSEAIYAEPNNTVRFADVPFVGVSVSRGRTLDGIGQYLADVVDEAQVPEVDVAAVLRQTRADVLVNYLPVGSEQATRWYMEQAPKTPPGGDASRSMACPSSATTSRARLARRSSIACWRACFATAACAWSARVS